MPHERPYCLPGWEDTTRILNKREEKVWRLTGLYAKHVQDGLHQTEDVHPTGTHLGQEEHQADAPSELRPKRAAYHVWRGFGQGPSFKSIKVNLCLACSKQKEKKKRESFGQHPYGYNRPRLLWWLRWLRWRRWTVWWERWWCRPLPALAGPGGDQRGPRWTLKGGEETTGHHHRCPPKRNTSKSCSLRVLYGFVSISCWLCNHNAFLGSVLVDSFLLCDRLNRCITSLTIVSDLVSNSLG